MIMHNVGLKIPQQIFRVSLQERLNNIISTQHDHEKKSKTKLKELTIHLRLNTFNSRQFACRDPPLTILLATPYFLN